MHHIQVLPFVVVNPLDVAVKNRIDVDRLAGGAFDVRGQPFLVAGLDHGDPFAEQRIIGVGRKLVQVGRMRHPAMADRLRNQLAQVRVRLHQPAAVGDAVGLVVEFAGEIFVEGTQYRFLENFGVNLGHAVDAVAADHRQMGHMDKAIGDDRHLADLVPFAGVTVPQVGAPALVDLVDDHEQTRHQVAEHFHRPLLERFRHHRMVGVGDGVQRDPPGVFPAEALFVQQYPHQFRHDHHRVGVVDMDRVFLVELQQRAVLFLEPAHDALQAGRYHEILLFQP